MLLFSIAAIPASSAPPVLTVDGHRIVDATSGREFVPHGVNWPSFEYACQQGWGYSNAGARPETASAMLEWNINTVRIPLNQDCWLGEDGLPDSQLFGPTLTSGGYRNAVESFVGDLTDAGIAVIVDLHWSAPPGYQADGLRPMPDVRSDEFWASVADRFKVNPGVVFDLSNEPHSRWDPQKPKPDGGTGDWDFRLTWNLWEHGGGSATNHADTEYPFTSPAYATTGMTALVDAVRSTGARQPIMLGGLDYANDLSEWLEHVPEDDQLIASFHKYPGQICNTKSCWNEQVGTLASQVPVITGEVGQNDCQADHLNRYMDWADNLHIGYLARAWWDLDLPAGAPSCTNFALIDDLDGTPTPGYGAAYKAHLTELPQTLPGVKSYPKSDPGLRIASAWFRGRLLHTEARLEPVATRPLTFSVKIVRKVKIGQAKPVKKVRLVRFRSATTGGKVRLKRKIPRNWTPVKLTVSYPGDARLRPDSEIRKLKVIVDRKR